MRTTWRITFRAIGSALTLAVFSAAFSQEGPFIWPAFAHDSVHSNRSAISLQSLTDVQPNLTNRLEFVTPFGSPINHHYASPLCTFAPANDHPVVVTTRWFFGPLTGLPQIESVAFDEVTGTQLWTFGDFRPGWPNEGVPSLEMPTGQAVFIAGNEIVIPAKGGVVYRVLLNSGGGFLTSTPVCFYATIPEYNANMAAFDGGVKICTPLTFFSPFIYFGYATQGGVAPGGTAMRCGIAQIDTRTNTGSFFPLTGPGVPIEKPVNNCAPAVVASQSIAGAHEVYVAANLNHLGAGAKLYRITFSNTLTASVLNFQSQDLQVYGTPVLAPDWSQSTPVITPTGVLYGGYVPGQNGGVELNFSRGPGTWGTSLSPMLFGEDNTPMVLSPTPSAEGFDILNRFTDSDATPKIKRYNPSISVPEPRLGGNLGLATLYTFPAFKPGTIAFDTNSSAQDVFTHSLWTTKSGFGGRFDNAAGLFSELGVSLPALDFPSDWPTPNAISTDGVGLVTHKGTLSGLYDGAEVQSVGITPASGVISTSATATLNITLTKPASAPGARIYLSFDIGLATIPTSVVVPPGSTTVSATVTPGSSVTTGVMGITVKRYSATFFPHILIDSVPTGTGLTSLTMPGGSGVLGRFGATGDPAYLSGSTHVGTITLGAPAPAGGASIFLDTHGGPFTIVGGPTVKVPAGSTSTPFTVVMDNVSTPSECFLSADQGSVQENVRFAISPWVVLSVSVKPTVASGFSGSIGTVAIAAAPGAGPCPLQIFNSNPSKVTTPASLIIPAGTTSKTFPIGTKPVPKPIGVTITAGIAIPAIPGDFVWRLTTLTLLGVPFS